MTYDDRLSWIGPHEVQQLGTSLRRLGFGTYNEYLSSPAWAVFRARYEARNDSLACFVCDSDHDVIHHRTYKRLGNEDFRDVHALCHTCHRLVHEIHFDEHVPLTQAAKLARRRHKPPPPPPPGDFRRRLVEQQRRSRGPKAS